MAIQGDDVCGLAPLVGSWRLLSAVSTFLDTNQSEETWGPNPEGHMVLEPGGRIMFMFASRDRVPPTSDAERLAMFDDLLAYTGLARLERPGKMVTTVDLAKNPDWSGEVVRYFEISGGTRLTITTPEMRSSRHSGRAIKATIVFEREHPQPT